MIVTKTPLRISFFGGGSDIPQFYEYSDGLCVSTTIDSYIYLAVNKSVARHLKVVYSELELHNDVEDIKHDRVREILKHYNINSNIEICSFSDVPTKGTGLGSSSTFTVGLINAIHNIKTGKPISPSLMAELACYIEIDKCKEPIGKQDQYAAAHGGLNVYNFTKNGVKVKPIDVSFSTAMDLNKRLLIFDTNIRRMASSVLTEQVDKLKSTVNMENTMRIVDFAKESIKYLEKGKLDDFGALLDEAWLTKKKLSSNVSNEEIDTMYSDAIKAGALGGKILGAGGGGYLMMYVPEKYQYSVISALKSYNLFSVNFEHKGSTVEMMS